MSDHIAWCVELAVKPGELDNFVKLTVEMVAQTAKEPGLLAYQRFISNDGTTIHAVERYKSSDAAVAHLQVFRDKFAGRFSSMVTRRRFTVYGTPNDKLKAMLDGFGAVYLSPLHDLRYWP